MHVAHEFVALGRAIALRDDDPIEWYRLTAVQVD